MVTALAAQIPRTSSLPRRLVAASVVGYAAVFAALALYGRPGLGIGGLLYVPLILAALAGGPASGALAGVTALVLYELGLVLSPRTAWNGFTLSGAIHLGSFVLAGFTVGFFASRARRMMSDSLAVLNELLVLARRDVVTGVADSGGLYSAVSGRIGRGTRFTLLLGEAAEPGTRHDERWLRMLSRTLTNEGEVARLGSGQFALLVPTSGADGARPAADELERVLDAAGRPMTFGWAAHPADGGDPLSLLCAASERLYARRLVRGEWQPTAVSAELVEELKPV